MNSVELIATIVTAVGVISFAGIFTILYRNYATSAVADFESGQCDVELIDETILANIRNKKSYRKVFRIVKRVIAILLLVLLVPTMLLSVYSKITNGVAMLGGRGMIAVASGSMSEKHKDNLYLSSYDNQFNTYDMIILEEVESVSDLHIYDVIAYVNDKGVNIIHRIVDVEFTANGIRYITRGDSNNANDAYKPGINDVLGKYNGTRIPYLGIFVMFLQSYSGVLTVAAIIYCLFMIESIRNKIQDAREARLAFLQDSIDFKTETTRDGDINSSFTETVYFKNYAYTFNEKGFVSKTLIEDRDGSLHQENNSVSGKKKSRKNGDGE